MSEAEVVYSDVKFTKSHGKTKETVSSLHEPTYAEVKTSKTQPSAQPPAGPQPTEPNKKGTVTSERVALVILSILLVAALVALGALGFVVSEGMKEQTLKDLEIETLKRNITESQCKPPPVQPTCPTLPGLNKTCPVCEEGWEQDGGRCYYFSTDKLTWEQSRDECRDKKGGDLVKIDSREEQIFLERRLRVKMTEAEDKFWIGLTDSQTEGTWLWTDNSTLNTSLTFWGEREPDDWKGHNNEYPGGEDCVRMGERGGAVDLKCWFDAFCRLPHKRICEKPATTGRVSCVYP